MLCFLLCQSFTASAFFFSWFVGLSSFSFVFTIWKGSFIGLRLCDWLGHWIVFHFFALRNSWEYFFIVDCDNITPSSLRVFVIWLGINNGNDSVIMHFCCLLWCFSLSRFSSLSLMCSFCLERKISPLYQPVHAVTQNGMKIKGSMNEHQLSPDAFLAVFCAGITLSSACLMYSSHPTLAPTPMLQ